MESLTPQHPDPTLALTQYRQAIDMLIHHFTMNGQPNEEETIQARPVARLVWELLSSRDRLQATLQTTPTKSGRQHGWQLFKKPEQLTQPSLVKVDRAFQADVQQEDNRLRKLAIDIQSAVDLSTLRIIAQPGASAWWWFLDLDEQLPWWSQYDWLWNSFSFVSLTAAFNLLLGVANKLLAAGPDALGILIITQGVLPLLAGGTALTTQGKQSIQQFLIHLRIPNYLWAEISSIMSVGVFLVVIGLRSSVSIFSDYYQNAGYEAYQKGQLSAAEENFNRAIKIDSNNFQATYQLGNLYQDLQDNEQALTNYKVALKGGISQAYDDITGIYLTNKQYPEADNWLWRQLQANASQPTQVRILTQKQYQAITILARVYLQRGSYSEAIRWIDIGIRQTQENPNRQYTLLTYFGWVKLLQMEREGEAEAYLQKAIDLDLQQTEQNQYKISALQKQHPQLDFRRLEHRPRPAAYCLMAQVKQKQGKPQQERENWEQCLARSRQTHPDEDNWISMARKRLKAIDNVP